MKYLVTGGCGFIGSNLVDHLIKNNNKVIVIDNESSESAYKNSKAKYYKLDILNSKETNTLYKNVDCVFHMAAKARIQKCILDPIETFRTNYIGTLSVLECSKKNNVRRIVVSSTSSIYGNNKIPQKETDKTDCLNPYSKSKLDAEEICKFYNKIYNMDIVILRYFNVYGPRQSKKGPYSSLLGIFEKQYKENKPLTIVGDGNQKRDFTQINDVIQANMLVCSYRNKINSDVFNVGSGMSHSVLDIAQAISRNYIFLPARSGESRETLANINKIKKLGYKPNYNILKYITNSI